MKMKRIFQPKEQKMQRHEEVVQFDMTVGWGEVEGEARGLLKGRKSDFQQGSFKESAPNLLSRKEKQVR